MERMKTKWKSIDTVVKSRVFHQNCLIGERLAAVREATYVRLDLRVDSDVSQQVTAVCELFTTAFKVTMIGLFVCT